MGPGQNAGNNLNIFLFEIGMLTRDPTGILPDINTPVAIHVLLTPPANIRYTDATRSSIEQTTGGGIVTKAGRALRDVSLSGSFGVENRSLALLVGTGELRFQRFWHEVVRLTDAVTQDQVDAEKDLARSPLLNIALAPYDQERSTFFLNYYDFWHNVQFEAVVKQFVPSKSARGGGAAGLTQYTLTLGEVGPIVQGGLATTLINGLFQILTTWSSVNQLISSYTLDAIVGGLVSVASIVVGQFVGTMNAWEAQKDGFTALMNGFGDPLAPIKDRVLPGGAAIRTPSAPSQPVLQDGSDGTTNNTQAELGVLQAADGIVRYGSDLLAILEAQSPPALDDPAISGAVDWSAIPDDGGFTGLDNADNSDDLAEVIAAARYQASVGSYYGMSREEFAAFVAGAGGGRDPSFAGAVAFTVTATTTGSSLQQQFGVSFESILRANGLLPDEALVAGRVLLIPGSAAAAARRKAIAGLPVFGSHSGRAAWGADLWIDMRVSDGDFILCDGEDVLIQGIDWTIALFSVEIAEVANQVPAQVRGTVVAKRAAGYIGSDRRIASVDSVEATTDPATGITSIVTQCTAINGGSISTGAA